MSATDEAIVREYLVEAWGKGNLAVVDKYVAGDYTRHSAGPPLRTPAELKRFIRRNRHVFNSLSVEVEEAFSAGDKVVVRLTTKGTDNGNGVVPGQPTGRTATVMGIGVFRLEDGQIKESWHAHDHYGVFEQLGLVRLGPPGPASPSRR